MEQDKKKVNLKIIIPIIVVAIVVIAVVGIRIVIIKNNTLTKEEQYAVDYLLCNNAIKPNTIEIHRVWVYQEDDKWYFAYDISKDGSVSGKIEFIYGNMEGITLEEMKELKLTDFYYNSYTNAPAKVNGKQVKAEKVYTAFQEQY